jgi:putative ABC transport system substrate-binding protein
MCAYRNGFADRADPSQMASRIGVRRLGRRQFLALLAGATALPLTAQAQQTMPVLGWVGFATASIARDGLSQGLRELRYVDGRNIAMVYRFAEGTDADFAELVEDLVHHKADIILAAGHPAARAAHRATSAIPIVTVVADPIGSGFAASLARPGGNMTGLSLAVEAEFSGKLTVAQRGRATSLAGRLSLEPQEP